MKIISESRTSIVTKYYHPMSMVYITLVISSVMLAHRLTLYFGFIEPGGIFIFPFTYIIEDIIAEIYGYKMSRQLIWSTILCVSIFSILTTIVVHMPIPSNFHDNNSYLSIFGSNIKLFGALILGIFASNFTNIYIIARTKIFFNGKYFILRTIAATTVCELMFNLVTYSLTYIEYIGFHEYLILVLNSWIFKTIYSIIAIIPSSILVKYLKTKESLDVYDYDTDFNPFSLSIKNKTL